VSDQPQEAAIFTQAGQPENPVETQVVDGTQQPKYITPEEARQIAREELQKANLPGQKFAKLTSQRIEQLENNIKELRSAGVITPAEEEQMRQNVINNSETTPAAQPPAQAQPQQTAPDPYTSDAWRIMEKAGTWIMEGDPEYDKLDMTSGYNFVKSVERLVDEKRQRLVNESKSPETRIPGLTTGGVSSPDNLRRSNEDLFQDWQRSRNGR